MNRLTWAGVVLGCLGVVAVPAVSQEIVHAITGTVVKVNPAAHVFVIVPDDGSDGVYKLPVKAVNMDFNRDVKAETVPAAGFTKTGVPVLLYFIGFDNDKTAVAVQELGAEALDKVVGPVVKYNKHEVMIAVSKGKPQTFAIDSKTVAEIDTGVAPGDKVSPQKGTQVRVVAAKGNGEETALFVRSLGN